MEKSDAFYKICGDCAGIEMNTITPDDIRKQAGVWADQGEPCDDEEIEAAISYIEEIHDNTCLMNPHSGTVQSVSEWQADSKDGGWSMDDAELIEVEKDDDGEWIEK